MAPAVKAAGAFYLNHRAFQSLSKPSRYALAIRIRRPRSCEIAANIDPPNFGAFR